MSDAMNGKASIRAAGTSHVSAPAGERLAIINELPTLQRNALRKIFNRPEFSPQEVAALGYRRLHQAEGIGLKGLQAIALWLSRHGCELRAPEAAEGRGRTPRTRRSIESALRLLRTHGYVVNDSEATPDGHSGT